MKWFADITKDMFFSFFIGGWKSFKTNLLSLFFCPETWITLNWFWESHIIFQTFDTASNDGS
jgi:hypothetical protein